MSISPGPQGDRQARRLQGGWSITESKAVFGTALLKVCSAWEFRRSVYFRLVP